MRETGLDYEDEDISGVGLYFGVPEAPCLVTAPAGRAAFSVTRICQQVGPDHPFVVLLPPRDCYYLMLYLRDTAHCDVLPDGTRLPEREYSSGSVCLVDLHDGAAVELRRDLDALGFMLPRSLFEELANQSSVTRLHRLQCTRGQPDLVLGHLGAALLPLFTRHDDFTPALLRHMAAAVCAHLLHEYRDEALRNGLRDSALSIWQERAAKNFMLDHLESSISVAEIAAATGLSANHFSKEFKRATGFTPYQWLTRMRIDRAKELLTRASLSLQSIANRCGFSDQSHFCRVFAQQTGVVPSMWREAMR